MKKLLSLVSAVVLLGCAATSAPKVYTAKPVPTDAAIAQLRPGVSAKSDVKLALGEPRNVRKDAIWGEAWEYSVADSSASRAATVFFGPDGRVWRVSK